MSKLSCLCSVKRAATAVRGQRQPFATRMTTSANTMAESHAAATCRPHHETTGIARMHPAKNPQATVWAILTTTNALGVCGSAGVGGMDEWVQIAYERRERFTYDRP